VADRRKQVIRAGLETLYFSGMHHLARQFLSGSGAILTFHRVRPALTAPFQPNRSLEITPAFLEQVIVALRAADVDLVSMDDVHRRLVGGGGRRRFVALTFDDGYRDNLEYAWPILKRHQVPFTLYVPSAFPEGKGELWWIVLEEAIARNAEIEVTLDGVDHVFDCLTPEAKAQTFDTIYGWLRSRQTWDEIRDTVHAIAFGYGIDQEKLCRGACLGWNELAMLAADPLTTIGAHTVTHPILAKQTAAEARAEMADGARALGEKLGQLPVHFSYPVGSPDAAASREFALCGELGFKTGVTTRAGVLFADHARHLTALPRISVNGEFQRLRYLDVLLSGAPTALMNRFRRVVAA
jgi:peptidoglycan/xylan/chitin deacetylase (PgdA/CDA1 family)